MSERQGFLVKNGLVACAAFAGLVLLMLFYATVSGAVDRAANHRAEAADSARSRVATGAPPSGRTLTSLARSRP